MINSYPADILCPEYVVFLVCLLHIQMQLTMNPDHTETKGGVRSGSICYQNTSQMTKSNSSCPE